jgi:hypothetical protein
MRARHSCTAVQLYSRTGLDSTANTFQEDSFCNEWKLQARCGERGLQQGRQEGQCWQEGQSRQEVQDQLGTRVYKNETLGAPTHV